MNNFRDFPDAAHAQAFLDSLGLKIDAQRMLTGVHLMRVLTEGRAALDAHYTAQKFSAGRFSILALLLRATDSRLSPSELAEGLSLTRGTITGLLDTLEQDGFVKRKPDKADKRRVSIVLTMKGRVRVVSMIPAHFSFIDTLLQGFAPDELGALGDVVDKLQVGLAGLAETQP